MKRALIPFLLLAACGGGDGTGTPADDLVTFASLPEATRAAFEEWKARPFKDCAWEQAFPSLVVDGEGPAYTAAPRVDFAALLASNAGSPVLVGSSGSFALLGPGDSTGSEASHRTLERSHTLNGKTQSLQIESSLEAGHCVITFGGEELHAVDLHANALVLMAYDERQRPDRGPVLPAAREATDGAGQAIAALTTTELLASATTSLRPSQHADALVAAHFELSLEDVKRLFVRAQGRSADTARWLDAADATPFVPGGRLYAPSATMERLFLAGRQTMELLYRSAADELIAVHVGVVIETGGANILVDDIRLAPRVAFSDEAFLACFQQRQVAQYFDVPGQARSPAFEEQFGYGCDALSRDGYAALAADAEARDYVSRQAFAGNEPPFRGWDTALIQLAQSIVAGGKSLSILTDSGHPAYATILPRLESLRQAVTDTAASAVLTRPLIRASFRWYFDDVAIDDAFLTSLRTGLENASADFPVSTETMLGALTVDIASGGAGGSALTCAVELIGSRKDEIRATLSKVEAVPYSGRFAAELRDGVLQSCPSTTELMELVTTASATSAFIASDEARGKDSLLFATAARLLVEHALEQRFSAATFTALEKLIAFGVVSKYEYCTHVAIAEQAMCMDSRLLLFRTEAGTMLSPALQARYAQLAVDLKGRWDRTSGLNFSIAGTQVSLRFFDGLWLGCNDAGFLRSKNQLLAELTALESADPLEQFEIERRIDELTRATTCL